jgi:NTE family protein
MKLARLLSAFSLALLLAACSTTAHYPTNPPVNGHDFSQDYRFKNLSHQQTSDTLGVMLTFSGGGTRAAALSHGVLEELANIRIQWEGKPRTLVDEIDIISAVSGGSVTAAHYALRREKHFAEFPENFLYQDLQTSIIDRIFSLEILTLLNSDYFGRIEIVAEKLDKHLFHGAHYGDLAKRGSRPYIVLNATDMSSGARFPFTQEQFDLICADLNAIPLARAVAASAAVPILFSPLTLKNYASHCSRPVHAQLNNEFRGLTPRQWRRIQELRSYRDDKRRPYIHLVDGGLVDNMAIWGSLDSTVLTDGILGLTREWGIENLQKALFIVVSAETDPSLEADLSPKVPSLRRVAQAFADIPINHNSRESLILFRQTISRWQAEFRKRYGNHVAFYMVVVSLRDILDAKERERFMRIPTAFGLPKEDVELLRQQGRRMLRASPEMQRFLRDTKGGFIRSETSLADR